MNRHAIGKLLSSHGEIEFDKETGVVTGRIEVTDEPGCLDCIYLVDVAGMRGLFPGYDDKDEFDILDAGLWYVTDRGSTAYDPPERTFLRQSVVIDFLRYAPDTEFRRAA